MATPRLHLIVKQAPRKLVLGLLTCDIGLNALPVTGSWAECGGFQPSVLL